MAIHISRLRWAAVAAAAALAPSLGAAGEIVRFESLDGEELVSQVFRLKAPRTVHIDCEGAGDGASDEMYAYGWILDLRTREPVWVLSPSSARSRHGRNYVFEGDISLPAGDYVAYYASFGAWRSRVKIIRFLGKEIGRIEMDDGRRKRSLRDSERWRLRIDTREDPDEAVDTDLPPSEHDPTAVVRIVGVGDNQLEQQGITLPARMQVVVYCIGEISDGGDKADHGWILDARTRRRVWELGRDSYKHAGGARKNKYARETITLPAGDYVVYYATDGSHSSEGWNSPPPYDPDSWGITVWTKNPGDASRIRAYEEDVDAQAIVSLIRQRNDSYAEAGVTVLKPVQVRVYALGEYSGGGEFVDQGWIEDARTSRRVWSMSEANTQPAGGDDKNRLADEVVSLSPGDYVVRYETDDSHAYREWNASPPSDPVHWGISLLTTTRGGDRTVFKSLDPVQLEKELSSDFLVRLVRIGDDAHARGRFRLDRATRVRIIAVGEGLGHEMYDFAWIESVTTEEPVWEMTPRNTRHAGGAEKNRVYDGTILLERGEYEVHYISDGSHAWGTWNGPHPNDPLLWGITVRAEATPAPK